MSELALVAAADGYGVDLKIEGNDIATSDGLFEAALISIFTDCAVEKDQAIAGDFGGWLGNELAETPGENVGSKLWLLAREKMTQATLTTMQSYVEESLAWMVLDGLLSAVKCTAEPNGNVAMLDVIMTMPSGEQKRFQVATDMSELSLPTKYNTILSVWDENSDTLLTETGAFWIL